MDEPAHIATTKSIGNQKRAMALATLYPADLPRPVYISINGTTSTEPPAGTFGMCAAAFVASSMLP